jgi:hypothetical protein
MSKKVSHTTEEPHDGDEPFSPKERSRKEFLLFSATILLIFF